MDLERVAVVSDYSLATLGGAETAYYEQVRTLGQHVEVTALSCPAPRLTELGTHPGVTTIAVPYWFRLPIYGLPVTRNTAELTEFFVDTFRERRIQLVHIHSEFGIAAAAVMAAERLGLPVVHTIHTFFWQTTWPIQRALAWGTPLYHSFVTRMPETDLALDEQPGNSALRNMTVTLARRVDRVVSPSAHQARRLREAGLQRVTVIPNTLAAPPDARTVERVGWPLRVVWVGRFIAEKRVLPFIRAARKALDALPSGSLEVDMLGAGEQFRLAQRLVRGYPDINLHGRLPHSEVQDRLRKAHVSVLTSVGWDNQPMVVVESINALRGVVVCDPALQEGLVGPGIPAFGRDEDELARVLISLARDPEPVVAASRACLAAREEFSVDTYLARTLQLYRDVLAARSGGVTP